MSNLGVPSQQPDPTGGPTRSPGPPQRPAPVAGGSRRRQVVTLVVLFLLTAGLIGGAWYFSRDQAENAKVGDCVAQTGSDSIAIVACSDPKAAFKVVGRVEDKTRAEAGYGLSDVCDAYSKQGSEQMYWQGKQGGKGFVLCLAKNTR